MGKVERNIPNWRLNGEDAWFMMFVSKSEKTSHQTRPSTRPERSARLIVTILSLWTIPKMVPAIPPNTISKKKPANLLIVGSAMVMPNQCNASGSVRPGVPSVTKLSMASKRPARSPANKPLRICINSVPPFLRQTNSRIEPNGYYLRLPVNEG